MTSVRLRLPAEVHGALLAHLLPPCPGPEEAAFVLARVESARHCTFEYVEWVAVPADGFASRSRFHLELSDATRAALIKRAHDLGAAAGRVPFTPRPGTGGVLKQRLVGVRGVRTARTLAATGAPVRGSCGDVDRFRCTGLARPDARTEAPRWDCGGRPAS